MEGSARRGQEPMRPITRRRITLVFGILGAVVFVAAAIPGWYVIAVPAGVLTIAALIDGYVQRGAMAIVVDMADWRPDLGGGFEYDIPRSRHGLKTPVITTFEQLDDGSHQEVECGIENMVDGTVRVSVNQPLRLEIRLV